MLVRAGMLGSGMNLITTAIGFGMSTTFIVFICARLLCGRIRSAEARAAAAAAAVTTSTAYDLENQSEPDMVTIFFLVEISVLSACVFLGGS